MVSGNRGLRDASTMASDRFGMLAGGELLGHVPTDLDAALFRRWGAALAAEAPTGGKFVVGGDGRFSTPEFREALVSGMIASGANVVDLGTVPTPLVHYARQRLQADGCAIVTGSHHPPDCNGLKWMLGDHPPSDEQIEQVCRRTDETAPSEASRGEGVRRELDVSFDYVAWLQETWIESRETEATIVLDPMHGCWAERARRYLQAVFPRVVFVTVRDEPDAVFHGHTPDCSRPDEIEPLCEAVENHRAHLGLAFDGDGDCLAVVDEHGVVLTPEESVWLMIRSLGDGLAGESFVHDALFSEQIPRQLRALDATALPVRGGRPLLWRRMIESGAVCGADIRGHYFFRALSGGDDALFAACWLIDYLTHCDCSLSEVRRSAPPVHLTPDLHVPADRQLADTVTKRLRTTWADHPQQTTDGLCIELNDGWVSVRYQPGEEELAFRFEASSNEELLLLVKRFCDDLPELGEDLWTEFELAPGER